MPNLGQMPFQAAVFEVLNNDNILGGMIHGIHDYVPQGSNYPYVSFGDTQCEDWAAKATTGLKIRFGLFTWSREGGRKQSLAIMERVYSLLHQASIEVEGHELVLLRFITSAIRLEDDGYTYRGNMQFEALLRES